MLLTRLLAKIEAALAAVAFAEAGEADTAREIMEQAGTDEPGERRKDERTVDQPGHRAPLAKHS